MEKGTTGVGEKKGSVRKTLIVLEGNECNFKTTVARKLGKRMGYDVVKGSSFEMSTGTNENLYQSFEGMLSLERTILDRYIYSNRVYATLFPKYTILTDEQFYGLVERMADRVLVVYLHADTAVLRKRLERRGDEYIKGDEMESINREYETCIHTEGVEVIRFDTEKWTSEAIVNWLEDRLRDTEATGKER